MVLLACLSLFVWIGKSMFLMAGSLLCFLVHLGSTRMCSGQSSFDGEDTTDLRFEAHRSGSDGASPS